MVSAEVAALAVAEVAASGVLEAAVSAVADQAEAGNTTNTFIRRRPREGLKWNARSADSSSVRGLGTKSPTPIFLRGHAKI